jgi:hypothetical protein
MSAKNVVAILGRSGDYKKVVEQQSGTIIKIEKKPWDSGHDKWDKEKLITIEGGLKNIGEAVDLVLDKIRTGLCITFTGVSLPKQIWCLHFIIVSSK